MAPNLTGFVCLVTGGSKGIGRGIALQLGQAGAKVYVTGRSKTDLDSCAADIKSRGGQAVPLVVDHSNDEAVEGLFKKISDENNGKLDVCVNNAYAAVNLIMEQSGKPFWNFDPVYTWDTVNNVGLRNHYLCTTFASRMMVDRKDGLIVNISSAGGMLYIFNTAYGAGKAAVDKMAHDCGTELKKQNVTMVSLWPGAVRTEKIDAQMTNQPKHGLNKVFEDAETIEFAGMAVANLAADANKKQKAAKILLTADLAREYGFVDLDGAIHGDMRSVRNNLRRAGWVRTSAWVPEWMKIPSALFYFGGYKF